MALHGKTPWAEPGSRLLPGPQYGSGDDRVVGAHSSSPSRLSEIPSRVSHLPFVWRAETRIGYASRRAQGVTSRPAGTKVGSLIPDRIMGELAETSTTESHAGPALFKGLSPRASSPSAQNQGQTHPATSKVQRVWGLVARPRRSSKYSNVGVVARDEVGPHSG